MNCVAVQRDLASYQFKTASESVALAIETHLIGCPDCLRSYFELKRAVEAPLAEVSPSESCRARIKSTVMRKLQPSFAERVVSSLRRPVPLYQGVAAAVIIVIAAAITADLRPRFPAAGLDHPSGRTPGLRPGLQPGVQIDSMDDYTGSQNIS